MESSSRPQHPRKTNITIMGRQRANAGFFGPLPARGTISPMRTQACLALILLGSASCTTPAAAALPLATTAISTARAPTALAAPMEDGSVYVLAEGGGTVSPYRLKSMWKRKAAQTCEGDYMVMSENPSQSRRAGLIAGRSYEGYVRCVSPEGMIPE